METVTISKPVNILENKIVEVRPIPREGTLFDKPISLFRGAEVKFDLPIDPERRSRVTIFKTIEEQEAFEKSLSLPKGTLNTHNRDNPYWNEFIVTIGVEGIVLNLQNPIDALKYKVIKANDHKIAPSWGERNEDARYRFAVVEQGYEDIEINSKKEILKEAYKLFGRIEESADKMIDVLSVLGKKVKDASLDKLKAEINRVIDDPQTIQKFVDILKDPDFDYRVLIDKALTAKALMKMGKNGYRLPKGEESIADDTREMLDWLKDPKNSAKVETIKAQIENSK